MSPEREDPPTGWFALVSVYNNCTPMWGGLALQAGSVGKCASNLRGLDCQRHSRSRLWGDAARLQRSCAAWLRSVHVDAGPRTHFMLSDVSRQAAVSDVKACTSQYGNRHSNIHMYWHMESTLKGNQQGSLCKALQVPQPP